MEKKKLIELKKEANLCTKKWTLSRRKKFGELLDREIKREVKEKKVNKNGNSRNK